MADTDLTTWIGRTEVTQDIIDSRPARLMQSILPGREVFETGTPLPPLWNWLYFHNPAPLNDLGRDGHASKGGFMPPVPLPRRMWAGGRFEFIGDILIGDEITRRSEIMNISEKLGKSGPLCFVTVAHRYLRGDELLWREEHDIVYREDPVPGQKPVMIAPPQNYSVCETITPTNVMLFRYSALTFNGHRIHYDLDYTRDIEGYPDLVFHGPLTATLLADFARRHTKSRLQKFEYRAVSPLFNGASFDMFISTDAEKHDVWASTPEGYLAMRASAVAEG